MADLGIGTAQSDSTPTTESLSAALRTALTPETRARVTAVAGSGEGSHGYLADMWAWDGSMWSCVGACG